MVYPLCVTTHGVLCKGGNNCFVKKEKMVFCGIFSPRSGEKIPHAVKTNDCYSFTRQKQDGTVQNQRTGELLRKQIQMGGTDQSWKTAFLKIPSRPKLAHN